MKQDICTGYQQFASSLADDALGIAETADLQAHLGECAACREFMKNIYLVRDMLIAEESRRPLEGAGPGFAEAVAGLVAGERLFVPAASQLSPRRFIWSRLSGAAAAAVLLVAAGWSWQRLTPREEAPTAVVASRAAGVAEEGSMASYLTEHTLQTMDATFLGPPEGIELARFEAPREGFE